MKRSLEELGLFELLALLEDRSAEVPDEVRTVGKRPLRLLEERDTHYDLIARRPHDCAACLAKPDRASE